MEEKGGVKPRIKPNLSISAPEEKKPVPNIDTSELMLNADQIDQPELTSSPIISKE